MAHDEVVTAVLRKKGNKRVLEEEERAEEELSTFTGTDPSTPHDRARGSIPKGKLVEFGLLAQ
jgi:hypothetical protein